MQQNYIILYDDNIFGIIVVSLLSICAFILLFKLIVDEIKNLISPSKGNQSNDVEQDIKDYIASLNIDNKPKAAIIIKDTHSHLWEEWRNRTIKSLDEGVFVTDLLAIKDVLDITYYDLLNCVDWKSKRLEVLIRDSFYCKDCLKRSESNHVHHTYYLKDKLPWDIDLGALVTLCSKCHWKRHAKESIKVYLQQNGKLIESYGGSHVCSRCNGAGYFPEYKHVQNGICFQCKGPCINSTIFSNALKVLKNYPLSYSKAQLKLYYNQYIHRLNLDDFKSKVYYESMNGENITPNNVVFDDDLPF
ncbi:MAG: hypothetical protein U0V74_08720 [Chitinophagales bacterium]